jgi:hypothetical protein
MFEKVPVTPEKCQKFAENLREDPYPAQSNLALRTVHWKDLEAQHEQLSECIKWLDEPAFQLLTEIDFFDYIYSAGENPFLVLVSKKWNQ